MDDEATMNAVERLETMTTHLLLVNGADTSGRFDYE
jgi:hypothetical protein